MVRKRSSVQIRKGARVSISDPKGRVDTSEFGCAELQRRKPKKMEFGGSQTPVWACDPKGRVDTLEFGPLPDLCGVVTTEGSRRHIGVRLCQTPACGFSQAVGTSSRGGVAQLVRALDS